MLDTRIGETDVSQFRLRLLFARGRSIELDGPADITRESTEAIVNAANSSLLGGVGVDGAIHRAGGPTILAECRQIVKNIGRLAAGKAVITSGGRLPAKYVIHTVGPVYRDGGRKEAEQLASCHSESIRLADEHELASLSFPAISTGAFGYPDVEAAPIAISSAAASLLKAGHVSRVRFVLFDISALRIYSRAARHLRVSNTSAFHIEEGPQ